MKLRFSLRMLFAVVTIVAIASGWPAHEAGIVQERNAVRLWIKQHGGTCNSSSSSAEGPSFIRRWFGDESVGTVFWTGDLSDDNIKRIQATFPGVVIINSHSDFRLSEPTAKSD
jgi:hypothetical protein